MGPMSLINKPDKSITKLIIRLIRLIRLICPIFLSGSLGPSGLLSYWAYFLTFSLSHLYQYAFSCTPCTARPLGSFMFLNALSQARASAVLHATLGTLGTVRAALSLGKCSAKMER